MIKEDVNLKKIKKEKQSGGGTYSIAYIDPNTSENLFSKKDIIKKYGAKWDNQNRYWFWFIGETQEQQQKVFKEQIEPCLREINSDKGEDEIVNTIDKAIAILTSNKIEKEDLSPNIITPSQEEIKSKLEKFKSELVNSLSDEDFKSKLEPIIKFRNAQGHKYSLLNTILIFVQMPTARLVKARSNWFQANKEVIPGSRPILMWVPNSVPVSKEERSEIVKKFLMILGKRSESQLSITEREDLRILLKKPVGNYFSLQPRFYDISQTKQIEGKEDIVGGGEAEKLDWFEDGKEDERVAIIYDSLLEFAKEKRIKVNIVDDIGGARGVSSSGKIDLLKNSGKDVGLTNTLVHELSHELLHQTYLSSNDQDLKNYFVGNKQGRAVVEQQAEVSAWIVMKNFGFDLKTSINYIGIWGADEKNVVKVFDDVAKVASLLIKEVEERMKLLKVEANTMFEEKVSGLDIAKLLGLENLYKKYSGIEQIKESFYKTYNKIKRNGKN